MKTVNEQRDEMLTMLCDLIGSLAEDAPSFTAQQFVQKARAMQHSGNHARALDYVKVAKSYVRPEKVMI